MTLAERFILITAACIALPLAAIATAALGITIARTVEHHIRTRNARRTR